MTLWLGILAAIGAAVLVSVSPTAASDAPFRGSFTVEVRVVDDPSCAGVRFMAVGRDEATHLGWTSVRVDGCSFGERASQRLDGSAVLTAANGDDLKVWIEQRGDAPGARGVIEAAGTYTVTGGTGRFGDAAGSGSASAVLDSADHSGTIALSGTLTLQGDENSFASSSSSSSSSVPATTTPGNVSTTTVSPTAEETSRTIVVDGSPGDDTASVPVTVVGPAQPSSVSVTVVGPARASSAPKSTTTSSTAPVAPDRLVGAEPPPASVPEVVGRASRPRDVAPDLPARRAPEVASTSADSGGRSATGAAHSFVTALSNPSEVSFAPEDIGESALLAIALLVLLKLPIFIINSTAEANSDLLAGWLHSAERLRANPIVDRVGNLPFATQVAAAASITGVLYGFLEPSFPFDRSAHTLVLGLAIALLARPVQ